MSNNEIIVQQQPNETTAMIAMIERLVLNPEVDIGKLEKMLDMQERILNRNAAQAYAADFALMQSELPRIARNGKIEIKDRSTGKITQSTPFAKLEDINDSVRPILQKYGFGVSFSISQENTLITVTAKLLHKLGHSDKTSISLPIDNSGSKNAVQGNGSTVSYGKRYALCALLNISTGDDTDGKLPDIEEEPKVGAIEIQQLRAELLLSNYDEVKFCNAAKVSCVEDLLLSRFAGCVAHIKGKKNASN